MSKNKFNSRKEAEEAVVRRATEDPAFRQALLSDPKKALEKAIGLEIPAGMKINVVEESARQVYLVLPPLASGEMNASELDMVAGGAVAPKASWGKAGIGPGQPGAPNSGLPTGGQTGGG